VPATRPLVAFALLAAAAVTVRAEYRTLETSPEQDAVLERVAARVAPGRVVVLDLDSTLLDNRPRQVAILRAWAAREGIVELEGLWPHHLQDWDLERTIRRAGVPAARRAELERAAKQAWRREFWTPAAMVHDLPLPGAARFVRRLHAAGAVVAYVGRRTEHAEVSRAALERFGFPVGERARLVLDDVPGGGRDEGGRARAATLDAVAALGEVAAAFENEGPKVDALRERWPDATVVHVRTDGPSFTRTGGPFVRGYLSSGDPVPDPSLAGAVDVPPAGTPLELDRVSDGDTIALRDAEGTRWVVRLIGIDTPEKDALYGQAAMADKRRRHVAAYGERVVATEGAWREAQAWLEGAIGERRVALRYDPGNLPAGHRDGTPSARVLAYAYVVDAAGEERVDLNAELCRRGFTYDYARRYPHARGEEFRALIREARVEGRGYWGWRWQPR